MLTPFLHKVEPWTLLLIAWVIALLSTLSALYLGEVLGQTPCVLCWYQRVFMFPLAVILGIASLRSDTSIAPYALCLAAIGLAVAAYHSAMYSGLIEAIIQPCEQNGPSCSGEQMRIGNLVPIPYLSLGAFGAIVHLLLDILQRRKA